MRIGSLCSGIGALDLAVLELLPGSQVWWHCEHADAPSRVLAHHWPGVPNYRDITSIDWDALPAVDVLTGGYPCQPFSDAGRRKGFDDERNLWPYVRDAIRHLRPRVTFLENVSGHRAVGFGRVLGDLAEDRLHVRWTSIRASDVGACHQRERVFLVVTDPSREGLARIDDSSGGAAARGRRERNAARGAGRDPVPVDRLLPTPTATPYGNNQSLGPNAAVRPSLEGIVRLPTPDASAGTGGGTHPDNREGHARQLIDFALLHDSPRWGRYEPAIARQEALYGRAPSPVEPNTNGGPRLAPAFAEWMMCLPAGWVTSPAIDLGRSEQLTAIGNGVVPPQAAAAYRQLLAIIAREAA